MSVEDFHHYSMLAGTAAGMALHLIDCEIKQFIKGKVKLSNGITIDIAALITVYEYESSVAEINELANRVFN